MIRAYHAQCSEVVERFDGYTAQYLGDGVLVYFGWPRAHEDDALRAVYAAQGVVQAIGRLGGDLVARGLPRVRVRVGIHTGIVVVGTLGASGRFETLAIGETPNIGARVQAEAGPDSVVITGETERLVGGYFNLEDLGTRQLKGVRAAPRLYRVLGASGARSRLQIAAARGLTPFVDRAEEREHLRQTWNDVLAKHTRGVLLEGEAGIGKSRLVHYLGQSIAIGDRAYYECRCSPYHSNTALHPVAEALRTAWELDSTPDPLARLDAALGVYDEADRAEARALLATLLDVPVGPAQLAPIAGWTPQRRRQQTLARLVELMQREAAVRPTVFVVEDLHWIDPSSHELIRALLAGAEGRSFLFLATTRPEHDDLGFDRSGMIVMRIGRLGREHIAELVQQAAGDAELSPDTVRRVAARTDGIPLFAEELTRNAVELGDQAPQSSTRSQPPVEGSVPTTLYGCLMARLDRLGPLRVVAQLGAVLGRTFSYPLLRAVCDLSDAELFAALSALVGAQILFKQAVGAEDEYTFKHALIQEAALQSIVKRLLVEYHRRTADVLVTRFPEIVERAPERAARHFTEAAAWPEAIDWWLKAGLAAIMRSANAEAIAHLSRALELLEHIPDDSARDAQELALRVLYALPLTMTRGWAAPEVGAEYQRANDLCERVSGSPQLFPTLVGLLTYHIVRGHFGRAAEMAHKHLALAEQTGDAGLRLEGHHDRGTTAFYLGHLDDALDQLDRCVALYVPEEHYGHAFAFGKDPAAVAMVHQALAHALQGRPRRSLEVAEAAITHTRQWVHPFSHIWALCGAAAVNAILGDPARTLDLGREVVAQSEQQGFPNWLAQGLCYLGHGLAHAGQHDEGIAQIRQGITIWLATGSELLRPFLEYLLADALRLAGDAAGAEREIDEAIAIAERTQEKWWYPELLRFKGELVAASSGADAARSWLDRALSEASSENMLLSELRAASSLLALHSDDAVARDRVMSLLARFDPDDASRPVRDARKLAGIP